MFSFLRDITGEDAHRFSTFGFYLTARMYRTHPLPPNLSTLLAGRDLSFPGIFEIHRDS